MFNFYDWAMVWHVNWILRVYTIHSSDDYHHMASRASGCTNCMYIIIYIYIYNYIYMYSYNINMMSSWIHRESTRKHPSVSSSNFLWCKHDLIFRTRYTSPQDLHTSINNSWEGTSLTGGFIDPIWKNGVVVLWHFQTKCFPELCGWLTGWQRIQLIFQKNDH